MRRPLPLLCLALLCLLLLSALPARAAELAGVTLPDSAEAGGQPLVLNGLGLRKVVFFKVYVAGLYLPAKSQDAKAILAADAPRRMVMHFLRDVDRKDLCKGWREGLTANTPSAGAETRADFDALCAWMPDIKEGQDMVFTYVPGQGTTVEAAGVRKGVFEGGKASADALFACWIGDKPGPGESFKNAVLGR